MKRAKLIIKGLKEPIFISEQDGLHARSLVEDSEVSPLQILRVGNWSGPKSEIRYVFFENETELDEVDTRHFSDNEMEDFKEQIEPFTVQKDDEEYKSRLELFLEAVKDQKGVHMLPRMKEAVERILEGNLSEEEIKKEAQKYVDDNFVGKLTIRGELRFLEQKKAIRLYENGTSHVLLNNDKKSLYKELSSKLHEYSKRNNALEYSKRMDIKELDILSQTMSVPDFIKNDSSA